MPTWRTCTLRFFTRFPAPFFWKTENSLKTQWFCENSIYLILKKKPLNPPSSAQRRKNMVQNHEKPNLSLFRAFGRGICSPPARCRIARAPDHVGGNRLARYSALKFRRWRCAATKMQTSEGAASGPSAEVARGTGCGLADWEARERTGSQRTSWKNQRWACASTSG